MLLAEIIHRFPWLRHLFADGGYADDKLRDAVRRIGKGTIEIVTRSDFAKGPELLPRRWIVESPPASFDRIRRLAKDLEQTAPRSEASAPDQKYSGLGTRLKGRAWECDPLGLPTEHQQERSALN